MRTKAIMEPAPHLSGVYFDDYTVTYTPTNIVQSNEYYPYGLQTASSWMRENATQNNFLANGGTELNTTSQLYDLDFRNYDPALGRMHQTDPMADKYAGQTTYNYAFNSPVNLNDPNGAEPPGKNYYRSSVMSHWSADFDESYIGSDYGAARAAAKERYHWQVSGQTMVGGFDGSFGDYVGHFDLDAQGYGFGDLYLSPSQKIDERDRVDNFWKNVMSAFHGAANKEEIYGQNRHGDYGIWLKTTFRDTPSFTKGTFDGIVVLNRFLKWKVEPQTQGNGPSFKGVPLIISDWLEYGSAFTLPGIGIFVHPSVQNNVDLLRHEYGHILQARLWGKDFYYSSIGPTSVKSFNIAKTYDQYNHNETWTEWTASKLSYYYFGQPSDWNTFQSPIGPGTSFRPEFEGWPGRYSPFGWLNQSIDNIIILPKGK